MFNIFRKKKPKIIFWSHIKGLETIIPIEKGIKFFPDWFKKLKSHPEEYGKTFVGTVKSCPSFVDFYRHGYVVPLWCDLRVTIREDYSWGWQSPSELFQFTEHSRMQYKNWIPENAQENIKLVLKANCPWRCKTEKGYMLMQQPLYYHFNDTFEVLPGFIDSDRYHEINQQMVFKKFGEFFIPRGTPLAIYYVIKRDDFELHNVHFDDPIIKNYNEENTKLGFMGNSKTDFLKTTFNKSYLEIRKRFFNDK